MPAAVVQPQASASSLPAFLRNEPHSFLQPSADIYASTLAQLKNTIDPLAASISQSQQDRLEQTRKKRKRGSAPGDEINGEPLRLKRVHVDGFEVEQVWAQVRRVIDAAVGEVDRAVEQRKESARIAGTDDSEDEDEEDMLDGEEVDSELGEEGVDWQYEGVDDDDEDEEVTGDVDDEELDGEDEDVDETKFYSAEEDLEDQEGPQQEYVQDPNGLNDGFFSIDDFNRQSQLLEQADQRGDDDGAASDEEDVDWNADPTSAVAGADKQEMDEDMADEDEDDEEDGPTFGNADLNAPEGDSDEEGEELEDGEMDDMAGISNTNAVMYADFFAPPATKGSKKKRGRPNPHNFPAVQEPPGGAMDAEENEVEIERTISGVHRDLFDDETEDEDEDNLEKLDPADPRSRRSTHERKRAALAEEIRRLEAANVAKREWTLSGEARAADRPMNSLLEEDLEFERTGKPVPVITAEVSEGIEDLIKRRILAQDFNDLIRRRPDDLATGKDARRGRVNYELSDAKSKKSLAELYEEEHQKQTDPNYVDEQDEKTRKEQAEILGLWKDIVGKLDSLSSWHFKPKQAAPGLDIRVDAPAIQMEDARPSAGADAAGASMLAPQELYKVGEGVNKAEGETVTRGGAPLAQEEMSRDERKRRRRRDKERTKKSSQGQDKKKESGGKREKEKEMLGDLKRGGVRVIGKKGDVTDVEGRKVQAGQGQQIGAGRFKL